jgi:D-isomer specific 2-hydroxyacid dehydrogenase-like protein
VLFWVPTEEIASALADLAGVTTEVVTPDGGPLPPNARDVVFYVPPFFPPLPAITAIAQMPGLRVVQAQTAGVERLLPHVPPGVTLCSARGVHDASTAEWEELRRGRLRAAVDVTDPEPLPPGHPWWDLPNVLITPHVAASTSALETRMLAFLRDQAGRFIKGEGLANVVAGAY